MAVWFDCWCSFVAVAASALVSLANVADSWKTHKLPQSVAVYQFEYIGVYICISSYVFMIYINVCTYEFVIYKYTINVR